MFGRAPVAGRFSLLVGRPRSEGGGAVACASMAPLLVLAFAVAADYANVSRFRSHVQLAADAASLAAAEAIARHPDPAGEHQCRRPRQPGRRCRFRQSRSARRRRDACGRGEEQRRRCDGDCRLCGAGPEQFRLGARLRRDQRRRFGDFAHPCRRFPVNVCSLSRLYRVCFGLASMPL